MKKGKIMKQLIEELVKLNQELALVQADITEVKSKIEAKLNGQDYKDDHVTITHRKGATKTTFDMKAFEQKEPELFKELSAEYSKTTESKATIQYKFK